MSPQEFLNKLKAQGVDVSLNGEDLDLFTDHPLDNETIAQIKDQKLILTEYLHGRAVQESLRRNLRSSGVSGAFECPAYLENLYYYQELNPDATTYNLSICYEFEEQLDLKLLSDAFKSVVRRHPVFSLAFEKTGDRLLASINTSIECFVATDQTNDLFSPSDFLHPFDLSKSPLIRAILVDHRDRQYLIIDTHHIVADAQTLQLFTNELIATYNGHLTENTPLSFVDYCSAVNEVKEDLSHLGYKFWEGKFQQKAAARLLSPMQNELTFSEHHDLGSTLHFTLPREGQTDKAQPMGFRKALGGFALLLSKVFSTSDFNFGITVSGRQQKALGDIAGNFSTVIPIHINIASVEASFEEFSHQLYQEFLSISNEHLFYEEYRKQLRSKGASELPYNVVLTYQRQQDAATEIRLGTSLGKRYSYPLKEAKFDLVCNVYEQTDNLSFTLQFRKHVFVEQWVQNLGSRFRWLLPQLQDNKPINDLDYILKEEKEQLKSNFQRLEVAYPDQESVKSIFESVALRFAERPAISIKGEQLTYKDVNKYANRVSQFLIGHGITKGDPVALAIPPSVEAILIVLGIIKMGACYVPIDPENTDERITEVCSDAGCKLLIHTKKKATFRPAVHFETLDFTDEELPAEDISLLVEPDAILYILYTSGTTGKPKGTPISHRNVVRLLFNDEFDFEFSEQDVWMLLHGLHFDFSVWELFGSLLTGAKLVIVEKEQRADSYYLEELIRQEKVSILNITPTAFYNLQIAMESSRNELLVLRYVIFGGEKLNVRKLSQWQDQHPACRLVNMYGITETTVHVTYKEVTTTDIEKGLSNVGRPLPTTALYLLDEYSKEVPPGTAGEIYVDGLGVAQTSYLNNETLSKERFVHIPHLSESLLFRSGDLGWINENYELIYLERNDQQVKIRGHRVELGEIENYLLKVDGVLEVVIVPRLIDKEDEPEIIAFCQTNGKVNKEVIWESMSKLVPDYLMPHRIEVLDTFPLTGNGKIDVKALLDDFEQIGSTVRQLKLTEDQERILQIWQKLIPFSDTIDPKRSFFSQGGDSIRIIPLISELEKNFKVRLSVAEVLQSDSVIKQAELISRKQDLTPAVKVTYPETIQTSISQAWKDHTEGVDEIYPMTDIQVGMCYFYLRYQGSGMYHDQFFYQLKFRQFDQEVFAKALEAIVKKHQVLRTSFHIDDYDVPLQLVHKIVIDPTFSDLKNLSRDQQHVTIKRDITVDLSEPFELQATPLWRLTVYDLGDGQTGLFLSFIHAILDGWSVSLFISELHEIYAKFEADQHHVLSPVRSTYKDAWIQEYTAKTDQELLTFWKKYLLGYQRVNLLGSGVNRQEMVTQRFDLGVEKLEQAQAFCRQQEIPLKHLLFSVFSYALYVLTGQKDLTIGLVGNTRPSVEDGEKLLGCFLNTVPIRVKVHGEQWRSFVQRIHRELQEVSHHDRLPLFEISKLDEQGDRNKNPFFDIIFNLMNYHHMANSGVNRTDLINRDQLKLAASTNTFLDFEINLTFGRLVLIPKFNTAFFAPETVQRLINLFAEVLRLVIEHPETKIEKNQVIPEEERQLLLGDFVNTDRPENYEVTFGEQLQHAIQRYAGNVAIRAGGEEISYDQVNTFSDRIATTLKRQGLKKGDCLGLLVPRSSELIYAILSTVKLGVTFIPIDVTQPEDRIRKIISTAGLKYLMVSDHSMSQHSSLIQTTDLAIFHLGIDFGKNSAQPASVISVDYGQSKGESSFDFPADRDQTVYIIFTSGTTGAPKGVEVAEGPLTNLLTWVNETAQVNENDQLLWVNSPSFDLSIYDVFGPMIAGATIRIASPEEVSEPATLSRILRDEPITIWNSAPALLQRQVPAQVSGPNELAFNSNFRLVMLSGDWIPVPMMETFRQHFPQVMLLAMGGATEATIWSNYYKVKEVDPEWSSIPYGKPIDNARYYILDEALNLCPIGVAGKLFIGGNCLAQGYYNNPELTQQRFIPNPYQTNEKIYDTGDMARWREDHQMEFLGRQDSQVKIRGFRIEIGEIEFHLNQMPQVQSGVVLAFGEKGEKFLAAYYVAGDGQLLEEELRKYLGSKLPGYMVPAFFVKVAEIPITSNGKVDRKGLPDPKRTAPKTLIEQDLSKVSRKIREIWSGVLEMQEEAIGTTVNYFEIGGDSLNILQVNKRIKEAFKIDMSVAQMFANPKIQDLEAYLVQGNREPEPNNEERSERRSTTLRILKRR